MYGSIFEFLADFNSTLVFTFGDIRFVYDNKTFSGRIFYDYINTDGTAKKDQAENYLHFTKPLIGKHLVQINQLENGFEVYFDGELVKEKIISDFKSWATTTDNIEIGYKPISWTLNNVILYSAKSYNRKLTLKECLQNYKALTIPIADRIIDTTDWEYVNYMQKIILYVKLIRVFGVTLLLKIFIQKVMKVIGGLIILKSHLNITEDISCQMI